MAVSTLPKECLLGAGGRVVIKATGLNEGQNGGEGQGRGGRGMGDVVKAIRQCFEIMELMKLVRLVFSLSLSGHLPCIFLVYSHNSTRNANDFAIFDRT